MRYIDSKAQVHDQYEKIINHGLSTICAEWWDGDDQRGKTITYGEENVTASHNTKWEYDSPSRTGDSPFERYQRSADNDHSNDDDNRNEKWEPESVNSYHIWATINLRQKRQCAPLENFGNLLEEVGSFNLLLRSTPGDIVREEVGKNRLTNRDWKTTEEKEATYAIQLAWKLLNKSLYPLTRKESTWYSRRVPRTSYIVHISMLAFHVYKRPNKEMLHTKPLCPNRYSKNVNPTFPDPMNTTVVASQISKLCM